MTTAVADNKRLTVQQLAELWGVSQQRILHFIACGKLRAVNVCTGHERPRWRITLEAIAQFEQRQSNKPPPAPAPRRKRKSRSEATYY